MTTADSLSPSDDLQAALAGLRLRANEAQLTQFIVGVASTDGAFAADLARILVDKARERTNFSPPVSAGFEMPTRLLCRAEERVWDVDSRSQGYVDLLFRTPDRSFTLLAELKLHSGYGRDQVRRYLAGLDLYRSLGGHEARAGLLAVTRNPPAYGEPERRVEGWLGSVRWADILDELLALEHRDPAVTRTWRTLLTILNKQGDLGMTRIERDAVQAWARARRGRSQLIGLLNELALPAIEALRDSLAAQHPGDPRESLARLARRGRKQQSAVFPHQNAIHLRIVVPSEPHRGERLRIQFGSDAGRGPQFSVEVRHPNAAKLPASVRDNLVRLSERLRTDWGLDEASELTDFKTYWAHRYSLDEWLGEGGPDVADRLMGFIRSDIDALVTSGIFSRDTGVAYIADQAEPPAERENASDGEE